VSTLRLGAVALDCADPGPLSTFWAELLGGEVAFLREDIGVVKLDHVLLTAMRVDGYEAPTWPAGPLPKQVHLDLEVDDLEVAERRAVSLGAVRAHSQPEPESHLVLLDPAGHPFCLSLSANFPT
jgi:Glyoxalase-like domain